jgi:hypothetical protein
MLSSQPTRQRELQPVDASYRSRRRRFIWKRGVLVWGGLMVVFTGIVSPLYHYHSFSWTSLIVSIPLFLLAGYWWGATMWNFFNRRQ